MAFDELVPKLAHNDVTKNGHAFMDEESRLKIYFGPNEKFEVNDRSQRPKQQRDQVTVKFSNILDALTEAVQSDRTWLNDFRDDEVAISKDLHDVILAYKKLKRSA